MHTPKTLIKQGAEAHLYQTNFLRPDLPCLLKHRPSKPYRHPILDARLTKHRCLSEARLLIRLKREGAGGKVNVPTVYFVDEARGEIFMEWIEGRTVREVLDGVLGEKGAVEEGEKEDMLKRLMTSIGQTVARMHCLDVVHGDLTTSNIMLRSTTTNSDPNDQGRLLSEGEIVMIDFGLGSVSTSEEDKAVDLYVLERAFISTHPRAEKLFKEVLRAYGETAGGKRGKAVLDRLAEVRMRGRKRSMVG